MSCTIEKLDSHTIQGAARWTVAAGVLHDTWQFGCTRTSALCVLVLLGLSSLFLVLGSWAIGRDGALEFSSLSNTLALFALVILFGDLRAVVCVRVGETLLLAGGFVGALGLAAGIGLSPLAQSMS